MANIPTIPGTQAVQSPRLGVNISPQAGLEAMGAVSDAVQTAANVISAYEEKKQKLIDVNAQNTAALTLRSAADNFRHQIASGKYSYDEIVPQWQETLGNVSAQINDQLKNASPEAQQTINYHTRMAGLEASAEFQSASDSMMLNNTIATAEATKQMVEKSGDPKNFPIGEAAFKQLVNLKAIPQAKMDLAMMEMKQNVSRSQVQNGLNSDDPLTVVKAYDDFNENKIGTDVPQYERTRILTDFRGKIKSNQVTQYRTLQENSINKGISYDKDYVKGLEEKRLLAPRAGSDYLKWQNSQVDPDMEAATVKTLKDKAYSIVNNSGLNDRQKEDAITDLKATSEYRSLHAPFVSDFNKIFTDIKSAKVKTEAKAHQYLDSYLKTRQLGDLDTTTNQPTPDTIKRFQNIFDLFQSDYAKHPEWTYDDITKELDGLVKKSKTGRQATDLTSAITGQVQD